MPPPDDRQQAQTSERDAFVVQLPTRLAAIEDIWSRLSQGPWETELLDALYERIREISESSKTHGLFQLNESVFSLEVYLSSFVDSAIAPAAEQVEAIDGLIRAVKAAAKTACETRDAAAPAGETLVFLLGSGSQLTAGLAEPLQRLGCVVNQFDSVDPLLTELQAQPPSAIVADTGMLPGMPPLSAELVRLRSHMGREIPLFFVSASSELQLRVDAIRAGGDGYFVAPLDSEAIAAQVCESAAADTHMAYRVLVVEDDPTQADFAGSILRKAGIEVMQVTEPVKVIESLRGFRPDLILMDIYMPEVNGIELTTVIRDHPEFVAIPIVFLSGEQNADKQFDALSVGGDDFIAKPIRPKHLLGVVQTRIMRARQLLRATGQLPKHDRVTGLFSRQHFLDRLAAQIDEGDAGNRIGVMLVRPDAVDELQRRVGTGGLDHLLAELGELVASQVDGSDLAARIDERSFGILLKRPSQAELVQAAERVLRAVAQHAFGGGLATSASIGLCLVDDRLEDANGIISRSSAACAEAAANGGNRVHVHQADADSQEIVGSGERDLSLLVRSALQTDGFTILYQPMLDLQTRGSETYEIILRLANASGDLVGDQNLLQAAEGAGLCLELDRWILERAIDILKRRRESGRRTRIFVRQSAHSALDPNMPAWLLGRLRTKQVVGTGLVIDFRLPDLSQDLKIAQQNIKALRDMDVEVALSRFPEKEAAFKVLRFLHASYINIAPRLLKADRAVISSVIRQAHDAAAKVIVSNVDDPRSIDLHWSSGADFLQGNFIQRPLENMDYDFAQVVI